MAKAKTTLTVYVVQALHWEYNDEYDDNWGSTPILTYRDRGRAEERRQELERLLRRGGSELNPFNMKGYGLEEQTSLTHEELVEAIAALGLEPADDEGEWRSWWEDNQAGFSLDQREAVWGLMDELAFYEIVEMELPVRE